MLDFDELLDSYQLIKCYADITLQEEKKNSLKYAQGNF